MDHIVGNAQIALFHACKGYEGPAGLGSGISAVARGLLGGDA